jgi:energy-converting hydrogenase Eha subunit H
MKLILIFASCFLTAGVSAAFAQAPFYQDKTIAVVFRRPSRRLGRLADPSGC